MGYFKGMWDAELFFVVRTELGTEKDFTSLAAAPLNGSCAPQLCDQQMSPSPSFLNAPLHLTGYFYVKPNFLKNSLFPFFHLIFF